MQQSIPHPNSAPPTPTAPRLRTVIGNIWPCKCSCGFPIPRDAEIRRRNGLVLGQRPFAHPRGTPSN